LGGYSSVLSALAGSLERDNIQLQLQSVVKEIRWQRGSAEIDVTRFDQKTTLKATTVIVTLPLGILQAGSVRFTPALDSKKSALEQLVFGPVLKLSLRFRKAFWEELDDGKYAGASFFHSADTTFPTFWTTLPLRAPLMTAWVAGPKAARLSTQEMPHIVGQALESLTTLFTGARLELEGAYLHNWQTDPYSLGAYSYIGVGGSDARKTLAAPLEDTLFFAGEATDENEAATVGGALQSGARVAREITKRFKHG
jgi:monoamine oxidase